MQSKSKSVDIVLPVELCKLNILDHQALLLLLYTHFSIYVATHIALPVHVVMLILQTDQTASRTDQTCSDWALGLSQQEEWQQLWVCCMPALAVDILVADSLVLVVDSESPGLEDSLVQGLVRSLVLVVAEVAVLRSLMGAGLEYTEADLDQDKSALVVRPVGSFDHIEDLHLDLVLA
jgi:uncharacterized membrane protein YkvI